MRRPSLRHRLRSLLAAFYRPPVLGACAILLGSVIAAPHVMRLSRELSREPIYLVEGGEVKISRPHEFVDPAFFRDALTRADLTPPLSVADPTLVPRLTESLGASPWVASVDHVSATLRDGVRIALTYRQPALMVRTSGGFFAVDGEGVVLPTHDFSPDDAAKFPKLTLFDGKASGVGLRWRDERVLAAASIVTALNAPPKSGDRSLWQQADLVEVRPAADGNGYELRTAVGTRVVWGEAAGDGVTEPTTDQKAGKLLSLIERRGSLDKPAGPYRIDLRRWDVIVLEPLAVAAGDRHAL